MSDDPRSAGARSTRVVLAVGFTVLLLGLLVVAVVTELRGRNTAIPEPALTASPLPSATQAAPDSTGR